MSNALVAQNTAVAEFTPDQIALIKKTVAVDATDNELALFLYQAGRMGLDPLARQIHFQKYTNKAGKSNVSFITTIDGYRLIADRTGRYVGNREPSFEGKIQIRDAGQYDNIKTAPAKATVTVMKMVGGIVCEFSASAYWEEFYPGGNQGHMWRKMPHVMLAKVAEAAALRKAFPADLSGAYTDEEMAQAQPMQMAQPATLRALPSADVVEGEFEDEAVAFYADGEAVTDKALPFFNEYFAAWGEAAESADALRKWAKDRKNPPQNAFAEAPDPTTGELIPTPANAGAFAT
jgi:phage recombination protein Bet